MFQYNLQHGDTLDFDYHFINWRTRSPQLQFWFDNVRTQFLDIRSHVSISPVRIYWNILFL